MKSTPSGLRSVAIVSSCPPPYGGITTHIQRLLAWMLQDGRVPYRLYETDGKSDPARHIVPASRSPIWFCRFLVTVPEAAVHFHTNNIRMLEAALTVLPLRRRAVILTLHGESPLRWYRGAGRLQRSVFRHHMRRAAHVICVSQTLADWVDEMGVPKDRVTLAPAFLPPSPQEVDEANLTETLRAFLASHTPLIGNHAIFGNFVNGIHIYSLDMVADLARAVREKYPKAGLCTFIGYDNDDEHREQILRRRERLGLQHDWLIVEKSNAAVATFARCDVFVRPTITDGDSVSVRECLSLGIPVVASDAVYRPPGCVLFRNRDMADLERVVLDVLGDLPRCREQALAAPAACNAEAVLRVYRQVLGV